MPPFWLRWAKMARDAAIRGTVVYWLSCVYDCGCGERGNEMAEVLASSRAWSTRAPAGRSWTAR